MADQAAVGQRQVGHDQTRRYRIQGDAPHELAVGFENVDLKESHHRVGAVAPDDGRVDVVELTGSLSPPSDRPDQRPVRPDHQDVIELAIEDV